MIGLHEVISTNEDLLDSTATSCSCGAAHKYRQLLAVGAVFNRLWWDFPGLFSLFVLSQTETKVIYGKGEAIWKANVKFPEM